MRTHAHAHLCIVLVLRQELISKFLLRTRQVVHLCDALRSAPSLTYIDLANNKIGDKGAIIMVKKARE